MTLTTLMVHDVVIVTATTAVDEYNDTAKSWGTGATRKAARAWISRRSETEARSDRETPLSEWIAFLPADAVVTHRDRIEWGSLVFEVVGAPNLTHTPRGPHHIEVPLEAVA